MYHNTCRSIASILIDMCTYKCMCVCCLTHLTSSQHENFHKVRPRLPSTSSSSLSMPKTNEKPHNNKVAVDNDIWNKN